jgi:hypothetical protein
MKCGSLLIYYKDSIRICQTISPSWRQEDGFLESYLEINVPPKLEKKINLETFGDCDGEIIAEVSAIAEAYWGGSSAELEVKYKCNKCGQTYYKELPHTPEELSEWITKKLKEE